jgi:hypothetical protein
MFLSTHSMNAPSTLDLAPVLSRACTTVDRCPGLDFLPCKHDLLSWATPKGCARRFLCCHLHSTFPTNCKLVKIVCQGCSVADPECRCPLGFGIQSERPTASIRIPDAAVAKVKSSASWTFWTANIPGVPSMSTPALNFNLPVTTAQNGTRPKQRAGIELLVERHRNFRRLFGLR